MSEQLGPKKSLLKFKSTTPAQSNNKTIINHKPILSSQIVDSKPVQKVEIKNQEIQSNKKQQSEYKTESQKAFDLIKKHRIIHKMSDKAKTTNKQRIQKMHKQLSKLPDHFDLSRTGQKIQKGY